MLALEAEGAIVVGKANADEFAWGVCGQNVALRRHRRTRASPRASPAARAAATRPPSLRASCRSALGTDTGGSLRMPAAACGVVGLKPAYGAVPVDGVFPLAASFDTVGPMARTVAECALAHAVLTGTEVAGAAASPAVRIGVLTAHPALGPSDGAAPRDERALAHAEPPARARRARPGGVPPGPGGRHLGRLLRRGGRGATRRPSRAAATSTARPCARSSSMRRPVAGSRPSPAARALRAWRARAAREPAVELVLSPTLGMAELPPAGVDELEVRLALLGLHPPVQLPRLAGDRDRRPPARGARRGPR